MFFSCFLMFVMCWKKTEGDVKLDGTRINPMEQRDEFAYVMQADSLWPTATVGEKESIPLRGSCLHADGDRTI